VRRDSDKDDNGLFLDDSQSDDYLTVNVLNKAHVFVMDADSAQDDSLTELYQLMTLIHFLKAPFQRKW